MVPVNDGPTTGILPKQMFNIVGTLIILASMLLVLGVGVLAAWTENVATTKLGLPDFCAGHIRVTDSHSSKNLEPAYTMLLAESLKNSQGTTPNLRIKYWQK